MDLFETVYLSQLYVTYWFNKALLGMLASLPWGRGDMSGSMNGKHEGVSVKYASLIVSFHWIKVFITA